MATSTQRARDDFSPKVKQLLAERVNFHCSLCDATTLGPKAGTTDKRFSVGKAAHIKAAAKGGPRYDETQTPEERSAIENGLWACATCADIIDRDDASYTADDLHRVKADAEWLASTRAGKPPGSELPALRTKPAIQRAVEVFCRQEAARQERLDPRFKVTVRMGASGPVYEVAAKDAVEAQLVVNMKDKERQVEALRDFFSYGGEEVFDGSDLRMEGSPLFQTGEVPATRWQLSSTPRPITMTVVLEDTATSSLFLEFNGTSTQGSKGVRLRGTTFGGLLAATLTADYSGDYTDFRFDFNLQAWAGKPVRRLPHFARVQQIIHLLASPTRMHIQCTHEGVETELGTGVVDGRERFAPLRALLWEIDVLRKIDAFFDIKLALPDDIGDVMRSQTDMSPLLELIELAVSGQADIPLTVTSSASDVKDILAKQVSAPMSLNYRFHLEIHGRAYGPFDVVVSCPAATVHAVGPATIADDIPLDMVMRAAEGSHWTPVLVAPSATNQ